MIVEPLFDWSVLNPSNPEKRIALALLGLLGGYTPIRADQQLGITKLPTYPRYFKKGIAFKHKLS